MTDREKIVEILKQACRFSCGEEYCKHHHEQCVGRNADYLIANGVTFATDTNVGSKWISVEFPPEEEGWYQVYTSPDKGHRSINKAEYCKEPSWSVSAGKWYWRGSGGRWSNVTHWMPLPEAPKED